MQIHRQELLGAASRRVRRGRKTTGRIVVSALGFGVAYYFDTENGESRRKSLHQVVQRTFCHMSAALAPDVTEPPAVFPSILRTYGGERTSHPPGQPIQAVN